MWKVCLCAIAGLLLSGSGFAEESPEKFTWGPNYLRVMQHVAADLQQQKFDHVLLIVQAHHSSQDVADETLTALAAQLQEQLATDDRNVTLLDNAPSLTFAKPAEVRELLETHDADAVLLANYLTRKNGNSLRLLLLTGERTLWVKRIRQTDPSALPTNTAAQQPQQQVTTGTRPGTTSGIVGTSTRRPGEPFTFSGSSGYEFERRRPPGQTQDRQQEGTKPPAPELPQDPPDEEVGNATGFGKDILEFAISNLGRQVGNGQCWTLAAEALEYAGAAPPNMFDFGDEVPLNNLQPGDILQFRRARFEYGNSYAWMGMPDHTAVVRSVNGNTVSILHQNFGQKIVTEYDINFQYMTRGSAIGYRAVAE